MTSPNRETEAQQVKAVVEQIVLTKVKASLGIKRGTTRVNLVLGRITTDQEQVKMVMILKRDLQEMVIAASDQDQAETVMLKISKQDHQETAIAVSDQEQVKMVMQKVSHQDHQEMAKAVSDQEQVKMAMQKASQEVLAAKHSNHVHLKKALLKRCQEMKAVVM